MGPVTLSGGLRPRVELDLGFSSNLNAAKRKQEGHVHWIWHSLSSTPSRIIIVVPFRESSEGNEQLGTIRHS